MVPLRFLVPCWNWVISPTISFASGLHKNTSDTTIQYPINYLHLPSASLYTSVEMVLVLVRCLWSFGMFPSLSFPSWLASLLPSSFSPVSSVDIFASWSSVSLGGSPSDVLLFPPSVCFGELSSSSSTQLPRLRAASSTTGILETHSNSWNFF